MENNKRRGRRRREVEKNYLEWCLLPSILLPTLATWMSVTTFHLFSAFEDHRLPQQEEAKEERCGRRLLRVVSAATYLAAMSCQN